ncbi:MAG: NUDIX hydrolase [Rhodospirillaceae bacterium]|nr:NUDIX hydrolase [Rhodospirillaceae bacterium]
MKAILARAFRTIPLPLARLVIGLFNTRFHISVVGVFLTPDGKVLVLKHVFRRLYPWGLPAGFVNAGESPEHAMVREVKEETGLDVRVSRVVEVRPVRPRHMEVVVAGAVTPGPTLRPNHEIFEGAFTAPDALPDGMMPSQAEIIRRVIGA